MALSAVITNRIACKASLLYQSQRPRGCCLVNAKSLRQLGCGEIWDRVEKLQRGKLRGMKATIAEDPLIEHSYSPGGLPKRGAVTRKRHQFHSTHSTCIYMDCQGQITNYDLFYDCMHAQGWQYQ